MKQVWSHVRLLIACTFIGASGLIASGSVRAAAIYSQVTPAQPTGAFSSIDAPGFQKIADNFVLSGVGPAAVRSLRFIGGVTGTDPSLPPDNFRIVIFDDNSGVPGNVIPDGDHLIGSALRRSPTSGPLLNAISEPLEYFVNLPGGVLLNSGNAYWISITNAVLPTHGWVWARANGLVDQTIATTSGDIVNGLWNSGTAGGMYFELYDHTIPEPTSLEVSIGVSLLMAMMPCWRRVFH